MRFHVVGLPARAASSCAYAGKVERFCRMMADRGHHVTAYLAAGNTIPKAPAVEVVEVLDDVDMAAARVGTVCRFDGGPEWAAMNLGAVRAIAARAQPGDFLCLIAGQAQQPIAQALPHLTPVEYGVGYGGTFAPFRVFESAAWMHTVYGHQQGTHTADGRFYDDVIPNYFDPDDFPLGPDQRNGGALYLGRMIERKGVGIAAEVCQRLGIPLTLAGDGPDVPAYGTHIGTVGPTRRAELLGQASVVLVPTLYVEPFGGVAVEAMLCGTPVVTTDWGAFRETVNCGFERYPKRNGFRARTLQEWLDATDRCVNGFWPRSQIRSDAVWNYGMDQVAKRYERYFARLEQLAGDGWYTVREAPALV